MLLQVREGMLTALITAYVAQAGVVAVWITLEFARAQAFTRPAAGCRGLVRIEGVALADLKLPRYNSEQVAGKRRAGKGRQEKELHLDCVLCV